MTSVQFIEAEQPAYGLPARPKDGTFYAKDKEAVIRSPHLINPVLSIFKDADLFYNNSSPQFRAREAGGAVNKFWLEDHSEMSHFLLTIYFFVKCIPRDERNVEIVFIGIHPGDHLDYLIDLFPNFEYYLYEDRFANSFRKLIKHAPDKNPRVHAESGEVDHKKSIAFHAQRARQGKNVYLIADYRNKLYANKGVTHAKNSQFVAEDTKLQLDWALGIKPKYAMMRFKPQTSIERAAKNEIVNDLLIRYPPGRFLKLPMAEKQSAFLICNDFSTLQDYYHDDIIGMIDHQNKEISTTMIYMNPFDKSFNGYITWQDVDDFVEKQKALDPQFSYSRDFYSLHICGMGWHHRAMLYIVSMYLRYRGVAFDSRNYMPFLQEVKDIILGAFVMMEASKKAIAESPMVPASPL